MEETKPIKVSTQISLLKSIFFYMNVSCFRILMSKSNPVDSITDRYTRGLCAMINVFTEYIIFNYFSPHLAFYGFRIILVIAVVFHGLIAFAFDKEVLTMATNYNAYYKKPLFYLYLFFFAIGMIGVLVTLNNQIGHVTK
jgi:hypothetical protein